MTAMVSFAATVLFLLVLPGPTNALLAAGGAAGRPATALILATLGGYAASLTALIGFFGPWIAHAPEVALVLKVTASIWLAYSAVKLWQSNSAMPSAETDTITPGRVMLTTFLNPKGLIIASLILSDDVTADDLPRLLLVTFFIAMTSLCWLGIGRLIARTGRDQVTPARINKTAAVVLALFSVFLGGTALAALG